MAHGRRVRPDQRLFDDKFVLPVAAFDIEQAGQRNGLGDAALRQVRNCRHVACTAVKNQRTGGQAEIKGVGRVKQGRRAATAFIAKEMVHRGKRRLGAHFLQSARRHVDQ